MAGMARSKNKGRRDGLTLQLPSHVQNSLNKEERMLHQTLGDIDRETKHRLKCISQDQQVAARKLSILERRLLVSQSRSQSAISCQGDRKLDRKKLMSRMDTCDSSYFKSLMTPAIKDCTELFGEGPFCASVGGTPKQSISGVKRVPTKSALKKGEGGGDSGRSSTEPTTRRKSVSFHSK